MIIMTRILVLSDRDGAGILFDGHLRTDLDPDREALADACEKQLRYDCIDVQKGDKLFFPDAAAGHRFVGVQ